MRRYLLDTGPLSAYVQGRPATLRDMGEWIDRDTCAASIVVYGEVVYYLKGSSRYVEYQSRFLDHLYRLTFPILERDADLRRQMRRPNGSGIIGDMDTLMAPTALERNLPLVTMNADFLRVPGLKVHLMKPTRRA